MMISSVRDCHLHERESLGQSMLANGLKFNE